MLISGILLYRLSLPAHAQFGELFKSVFDQYPSKLVFDDVLQEVAEIMALPSLGTRPEQEKNMIVSRYLKWHRIRDAQKKKNLTVAEWKNR